MKWWILLLPLAASAQPISWGLKVGAPVTEAFSIVRARSVFAGDTGRFVIGPTFELRLPAGFGVEVDALYRSYQYSYAAEAGSPGDVQAATRKASQWEFPFLLKYRSAIPLVKPYAVGGLSFNRLSGAKQTLSCFGGTCGRSFSDIAHDTNIGLVLGTGLQVSALVIKISPEIRYTRWGFANFDIGGGFGSALKSNQNQFDVLVGITF